MYGNLRDRLRKGRGRGSREADRALFKKISRMPGHPKESRKKVLCASEFLAANSLESIPGVLKIVFLIGFF